MATEGLAGKKFVGKVVEGFDPLQRGRYYVHVPEFQPHMPESKGILLPNATHAGRTSQNNAGTSGSNYPLHPGDQVQVICLQDDINSSRIDSKISDDQPKSDSGAGKLMGVEPSGKVIPCVISGLPENIPFGSAGSDIVSKFTEILNTGGEMAQELLNSVKDKLGDAFKKVEEMYNNASEAISSAEEQFNNAVQNVKDAVIENGKDAVDQFSNATIDDSKIGGDNEITEEEEKQGFIGTEDEIIDKFLGEREGISNGG